MRQVARRLWNLLSRLADRPPSRPAKRNRPSVRLELCQLETRLTPSASTLGTVSGAVVFAGGVNNSQFLSFQGIQVTLAGTSNQGDAVDMTAVTDGSGTFAFRSVEAGTYDLTAAPDGALAGGGSAEATVVAGQSTTQDVTVTGLAAGLISLRDFLNTAPNYTVGLPTAGPLSDNPPVVSSPISNFTIAAGGSGQMIDLAANFSDPDMTNSQVVFDTSDGPMVVNLNDTAAPQTVANFLDYVETSRYDSTIFHRLDTSPPVLQGGGFGLQTNSSGDVTAFPSVANANDPQLANEFSSSNPDVLGTLAMAKPSGDPNSATSQFFFNLADNSTTLGSSNNGGFAVFGSVASDPTSQAVFQALQSSNVTNESSFNSAFGGTSPSGEPTPTLPISSAANLTNFPTNTTPSDYLTINGVQVTKQDESLTYSVVGNTDPSLVNVSFVAGHPEVLSVNPVGSSGTATITVQATDDFGLTVQTSFQVTVDPLAITSVTNPINESNLTSTTASGTAAAGASISVTATDGTNTTDPVTATAGSNGAWTATVNVNTLNDGTITYTATTTAADGTQISATKTSTKDTAAPTVAINSPTTPVTLNNENAAPVSGTGTVGAAISVTATDGTTTTKAVTTTVAPDGTWSVNLNVSGLKDSTNAITITYNVVATSTDGNTAATHTTASKNTVAITSVTTPINAANDTDTSASGTTEAGASVSVTATDGTTTTAPVVVTADPTTGDWTANGIDVSGLNDGTITYTATATDPSNSNTATATATATKSTTT